MCRIRNISTDGRRCEQFNEVTKGRDFVFDVSPALSRQPGESAGAILNFRPVAVRRSKFFSLFRVCTISLDLTSFALFSTLTQRSARPTGKSRMSLVLAPKNLSLIHISEPTRLLSISYAVFCLKK